MRLLVVFAAFLISGLAFSDDKKPEPKKVVATGSVRLNGKALDECSVMFHPSRAGKPIATKTDANGNYKIELPPDDYTMSFEKLIPTGMKDPPTRNVIPSNYTDPKTSMIKVSVKDGENEFIIELKSK